MLYCLQLMALMLPWETDQRLQVVALWMVADPRSVSLGLGH